MSNISFTSLRKECLSLHRFSRSSQLLNGAERKSCISNLIDVKRITQQMQSNGAYYYYYYYYLLHLGFHSVAVVLTLVTNKNKHT